MARVICSAHWFYIVNNRYRDCRKNNLFFTRICLICHFLGFSPFVLTLFAVVYAVEG